MATEETTGRFKKVRVITATVQEFMDARHTIMDETREKQLLWYDTTYV